jgi:hypothetical protein
LEGTFADSIIESPLSPFLSTEYDRLKVSLSLNETGADAVNDQCHSLELLGGLEDRRMENRRRFREKRLFSDMEDLDGCVDFV